MRVSLGDIAMDNIIHIRVNGSPEVDYNRVSVELDSGHGEPKNQIVLPVYPIMKVGVAYARTRDAQEVTLTHSEHANANIDHVRFNNLAKFVSNPTALFNPFHLAKKNSSASGKCYYVEFFLLLSHFLSVFRN